MHFRVANNAAALQARALAGIRDRFHTPVARPPDSVDWNAVLKEVHETAQDPVARAELNARLRIVMPQLIQEAMQAPQEQ